MAATEGDDGRRAAGRTIALPQELADAISTRVGPEEFDAYVIDVLERQVERERIDEFEEQAKRDGLRELIAAYEREHGPLPQQYLDEAEEAFRRADQREAEWRAKNP